MKTGVKVTIAALSSVLLLGSMNFTAEAAPSKSVKTAAAKPQAVNKAEQLEKEEIARINKLLEENPDDSYMVYVSNELTKGKGLETFAMGNIYPEYTTYEDYWIKASTLKEPIPKQPDGLPEGYSFAEGKIIGPNSGDYQKEMKAEAKKLGKQIYSKKINWTTTNLITLKYKNGDNYIQLQSTRLASKDNKQKGYTYLTAEEMKKKNPKSSEKYISNTLSLIENDKAFAITTNPGNPSTKDDLIKLAKTAVKK
jgi:hypothetical protein